MKRIGWSVLLSIAAGLSAVGCDEPKATSGGSAPKTTNSASEPTKPKTPPVDPG